MFSYTVITNISVVSWYKRGVRQIINFVVVEFAFVANKIRLEDDTKTKSYCDAMTSSLITVIIAASFHYDTTRNQDHGYESRARCITVNCLVTETGDGSHTS